MPIDFGPFGPFGAFFGVREFIFGLIAAVIVLFVLWKIRGAFTPILAEIRRMLRSLLQRLRTRAVDRYQVELIGRAETMHLARAIFALDEVLIEPRVLVPPAPVVPNQSEEAPGGSTAVVPNLPDADYLSAVYVSPTLSLPQALSSGVDLLLTGELGSGRSTALAYLAIRLANRDPAMGELAGRVPILLHVADLALSRQEGALERLTEAAQRIASPSVSALLPSYLQRHFQGGTALLLLDGLDELGEQDLPEITDWIQAIQAQYPQVRIIATGSSNYIGRLGALGLAPVSIAPWSEQTVRKFLRRWLQSWEQFVIPRLHRGREPEADLHLLNGWLANTMRGLSPAEITLRVWAAYAGDTRGQRPVDDFESYAARILSQSEQGQVEATAMAWLKAGTAVVPERSIVGSIAVPSLSEAGVLIRHEASTVSFAVPVVGAYFGARAMSHEGVLQDLINRRWEPGMKALQYLAALGDVEPVVTTLLHRTDDPLDSGLLAAARWLRDAPTSAAWRGKLLRELAKIVHESGKPYGLRLRGVHVLAGAAEETVSVLFNRMLKSQVTSSRVLGALGLGGMSDEESVERLVMAAQSDPEMLVRQASCLALGAIGSDAALEGLGQALLGGDQELRLAAAEALAVDPDEGFGMLRDAAVHDEIMTRRAAVFGLARVMEDWALKALEKIKVDDQEWIVRGAAAELLDRRLQPPWTVHRPASDPQAQQWLNQYAEQAGLALGSDRASVELLKKALNDGSFDLRLAALETLSWGIGEELTLDVFRLLDSGDEHVRDAAFEALWRLASTGVELPDPMRFGMG